MDTYGVEWIFVICIYIFKLDTRLRLTQMFAKMFVSTKCLICSINKPNKLMAKKFRKMCEIHQLKKIR